MQDGLVGEAEQAVAAGDLKRAATLLRQAAESRPDDPSLWMKAAALLRATGEPQAALDAVHRALTASPLDFTMLLMRASLLQRLGHPEAGQAWGHAIAQKPTGDLPPQIEQVLAEAERHHSAYVDARETRLKSALSPIEKDASAEERKRIERFRDNVVGRTKVFHSAPTHFHFPELTEREFHPRHLFPWLEDLEAATDTLAEELQTVMAAERAELVPYIQYDEHLPLDQWRPLNKNPDWTAIHLWRNGSLVEANARHCPRTIQLLKSFPQPTIRGSGPNAMFSLLAPKTEIPAHVGVNNARLVCHLPLIVPEGCWFRVGAETRYWKRGEAFVFDDTIEHEALNPSDELRVVFIFDVWHPDLSTVERDAVAALIGAEGGVGAL
ncbi:aspartyl/asparaginyl beta-hydroxylase domain-containing protein [Sphingomonas sp. SM33]|uniref:Aspartyl/asparaginyl beta-hydroxylase domain-containing protein n=1 Tax=Sphingomonas telluris TaxID=2907998 RepID=A0ABS9VQ15_9SPHN|nr:aspartyl/asparaginyl beta-hydroxylase domain-containing protein [Sphingomonas telluris]MCH8617068.1 aspartyl/asparaginyl beta-hydroxylase domain-containing protein [Sphingomonas telluris]